MIKGFADELEKIRKVLDKLDFEIGMQEASERYDVMFHNLGKSFELFNICGEELCNQLHLMHLAKHSATLRKLMHNYKHTLMNLLRVNCNLQEQINMNGEVRVNPRDYTPKSFQVDPVQERYYFFKFLNMKGLIYRTFKLSAEEFKLHRKKVKDVKDPTVKVVLHESLIRPLAELLDYKKFITQVDDYDPFSDERLITVKDFSDTGSQTKEEYVHISLFNSLKRDHEVLKGKSESLEKNLAEAQAEIGSLNEEVLSLHEACKKLRGVIRDLESSLEIEKKQKEDENVRNQELSGIISRIRESVTNREKEIKEKGDEIKKKQEEIVTLESKLMLGQKEFDEELAKQNEATKALRMELEYHKGKMNALEGDAQKTAHRAMLRVQELESVVEQLNSHIQTIQGSLQAKDLQIMEAEARQEGLMRTFEEERQTLEEEKSKLAEQLKAQSGAKVEMASPEPISFMMSELGNIRKTQRNMRRLASLWGAIGSYLESVVSEGAPPIENANQVEIGLNQDSRNTPSQKARKESGGSGWMTGGKGKSFNSQVGSSYRPSTTVSGTVSGQRATTPISMEEALLKGVGTTTKEGRGTGYTDEQSRTRGVADKQRPRTNSELERPKQRMMTEQDRPKPNALKEDTKLNGTVDSERQRPRTKGEVERPKFEFEKSRPIAILEKSKPSSQAKPEEDFSNALVMVKPEKIRPMTTPENQLSSRKRNQSTGDKNEINMDSNWISAGKNSSNETENIIKDFSGRFNSKKPNQATGNSQKFRVAQKARSKTPRTSEKQNLPTPGAIHEPLILQKLPDNSEYLKEQKQTHQQEHSPSSFARPIANPILNAWLQDPTEDGQESNLDEEIEPEMEEELDEEDALLRFKRVLEEKEREKDRILKKTFKRLRNKFREDPENFKRQFEQAHKKKLWAASMTTEREEGIENGEIFLSFEEFKKFHQESTLGHQYGCEHCINLKRFYERICTIKEKTQSKGAFPISKTTISKLPILHSQLVSKIQQSIHH